MFREYERTLRGFNVSLNFKSVVIVFTTLNMLVVSYFGATNPSCDSNLYFLLACHQSFAFKKIEQTSDEENLAPPSAFGTKSADATTLPAEVRTTWSKYS